MNYLINSMDYSLTEAISNNNAPTITIDNS